MNKSVWNFPDKILSSTPPIEILGDELHDWLTNLCLPTENTQTTWVNLFLQCVILVRKDILPPPICEKPINPENKFHIGVIQYLIQFFKDKENDQNSPKDDQDFKCLNNFVDDIIYMLISFSILKSKHMMNQSNSQFSSQFNQLPRNYTS